MRINVELMDGVTLGFSLSPHVTPKELVLHLIQDPDLTRKVCPFFQIQGAFPNEDEMSRAVACSLITAEGDAAPLDNQRPFKKQKPMVLQEFIRLADCGQIPTLVMIISRPGFG